MTGIPLSCLRVSFALSVVLTQLRGQTAPQVIAVTTATNFSVSWPEPGGLGVVFCRGLTRVQGVVQPPGYPLPDTLAGVQVNVGDVAKAPILAIADFGSYQQINFQVPWILAGAVTKLSVSQDGVTSGAVDLPSATWAPLFVDASGLAVAQHAADYRRVTRDDPARPGEWIIVYGSSIGAVRSPPISGMPAPADALSPVLDSMIMPATIMAGEPTVLPSNYIGLTPATVGVWQVNLRLPDSQPDGNVQLVMLREKFCGFFFVMGCGRGFVTEASSSATLPVKER